MDIIHVNLIICIIYFTIRFDENSQKIVHEKFTNKKVETQDDIDNFSYGIPSIEIKNYLNAYRNFSYSKNMEAITSLNSTHPQRPTDIGFDPDSKAAIGNLCHQFGPDKETIERYITITIKNITI